MRLLLTLSALLVVPLAFAQLPAEMTLVDTTLEAPQGLAQDTEVTLDDAPTFRWDNHPETGSARFSDIPADWTGYQNLEFSLHSEVANGAEFMLIIRSENPDTEGMDYWSRKFRVDWTGWEHFKLPLRQFGAGARQPLGWDKIDSLYFTASGWACEPRPDTVMRISSILLTNDPALARLESVAPGDQGQAVCKIRLTSQVAKQIEARVSVEAPEGVTAATTVDVHEIAPGGSALVEVTVALPSTTPLRDAPWPEESLLLRFPVDGQPDERAASLAVPMTRLHLGLMATPPHPRVLMSPEILADIKRRAADHDASKETAHRVISSADSIIKRYADGFPAEETASIERGRALTGRAETLAMAYLLTGDEKYAHETARLIDAASTWSTWVYEFHKGTVADLGTAGALRHFGIAYDWAWQGMTEDERAACRDTIATGLDLWVRGIEDGVWWSRSFRNNWCAVCCGGGALAAMALLDEYPRAQWAVGEAYSRIVKFLNEGGVDGGWPEGTGYWGYGVSHATLYAEALKTITSGRLDLFQHPYLQATWQFPLYMACPPGGTINFADCGYGWPNSELTLQLARQTGNPQAAWYYRQRPRPGTLSLLWDTDGLEDRPPTDLPQSIHFRGIDWAALRSGWDADATIFGIRGGSNGENHGMLECGNFVINSMGARLIMDYGATTYTHEYFSGKRWDFYRANTHGSNCILVDDADQKPGREAAGQIKDFFTSKAIDYLRLDAAAAYPDFVKQMDREVLFIKPGFFLMVDTVKTHGDRRFEWRCHPATGGDIALGEDRMVVENGRGYLATRWLLPDALSVSAGQEEGEDYHVSVTAQESSDTMRFVTVMHCGGAAHGKPLYKMGLVEAVEAVQRGPRVLLIMGAEGNEWRFIRDIFLSVGIGVDWVDEDRVADLPEDSSALADYGAIFLAPWGGAQDMSPAQQGAIADYVRNGGGLMMVGGTKSFGAGGFADTTLGGLLPVEMIREDDNVTEVKQTPKVTAPEHPVLAGLPSEWPAFGSAFGGYHHLRLRDGAEQLLAVDPTVADAVVPFIAAGTAGSGRVMTFGALWAFGTGQEFKTWEHAGTFLGNCVAWLSEGTATPDRGRDLVSLDLEGSGFPLSDENLKTLQWDNALAFSVAPWSDGAFAVRTGEGLIGGAMDAEALKTDARILVFAPPDDETGRLGVFAAIGVTKIAEDDEDGQELLTTDKPVIFVMWGPDANPDGGYLICSEVTNVEIDTGGGSLVLNGDPVQKAEGETATRLVLEAGRHDVMLRD